jgi:heme A synthase
VLIGLGAYVRGQGAGLAFLDWPLMNGRLLPDFGVEIQVVHFLHRAFAVVVAALLVALLVRVLRDRPWPHPAAVVAVIGAGLFVVQVLVGAAQVWTRLAEAPVIAHVALAGLVWGSLVAVALCVRLPARAGVLA